MTASISTNALRTMMKASVSDAMITVLPVSFKYDSTLLDALTAQITHNLMMKVTPFTDGAYTTLSSFEQATITEDGSSKSPSAKTTSKLNPSQTEPTMTTTIEAILAQRQKTHGDFTDNARVMQNLKDVVHCEKGWNNLSRVQREAIHMILHKIGRILSGNPNEPDHWHDIAGYAELVKERIPHGPAKVSD